MRAVVWCNGPSPSKMVVDSVMDEQVAVFGVDGGADKAREHGISAIGVLGDLDSVDRSQWNGLLIELPDQSSSDLSKSIEYLARQGFSELDIIGIEGGKPDHSLGNWASLVESSSEISVRLHHEEAIAHRVNLHTGKFRIHIDRDEEFSVFALERCSVSICGAKWEIKDKEVNFGTRGLHNRGIGDEVAVESDGTVVVLINRGYSSS